MTQSFLTAKEHRVLSRVARKEQEAELCLKGGNIINCLSGRMEQADIAICQGRIAATGAGFSAREYLDCSGLFISPGFIDAHIHIESTMLCPAQFARAVIPRGTCCVVADPHEIANCLGLDGVRYMVEEAQGLPMDIFYTAPSCVPATHLETSGAELGPDHIEALLRMEGIVGLGEMMNFPGVVFGDEEAEAKLEVARRLGKVMDGHAPGLSGEMLCAYISAGIDSDHECTTWQEAREKLDKGMYLFLRQGTSEQNLRDLLPAVDRSNFHRCCLVSDDRDPADLMDLGHMDYSLKVAVDNGLDPLMAVSMVTLNPARRFCLVAKGAIAPGFYADLVLLKDLKDFSVEATFFRGKKVAQEGRLVAEMPKKKPSEFVKKSIVIGEHPLDFSIEAKGEKMRVIGIRPGQIVTDELIMPVKKQGHLAVADPENDVIKLAVLERHHGSGSMGLGFVRGLGLRHGAIAASVAHDSHNIIVAGVSDSDMKVAVSEIRRLGGGLVVVKDERVLAALALPVSGLMSDRSLEEVRAKLDEVKMAAASFGTTISNPFMILSFLALPVIPTLKLTDKGLVDVKKFSFVPLFFH